MTQTALGSTENPAFVGRPSKRLGHSPLEVAMAYPGQLSANLMGSRPPAGPVTAPFLPIMTNGAQNLVSTTTPTSMATQFASSSLLATNSPLRTSVIPPAQLTSTLYTPQAARPISLKTGFTLPVSDLQSSQQRLAPPSTLINPEYLNEESLLDVLMEDLVASSSSQESDIRSRADLLSRAQATSLELWTISSNKIAVTVRCNDEVDVTEYVQSQTAEFNSQQAHAFQAILTKVQDLNSGSASDTLFSQTASEIALSRLIHHYYLAGQTALLKAAFARISKTLGKASHMSTQTLDVLRGLLYFSGLALNKLSERNLPPTTTQSNGENDLLNLLDAKPSTTPESSTSSSDEPTSVYILKSVMEAQSLTWASALLIPTMDDVLIAGWLAVAFDPRNLPSLQEPEMLRILSQIPWSHLANLSPNTLAIDFANSDALRASQKKPPTMTPSNPAYLESVKTTILVPIQNALAVAAGKNFVAALVLMSKILALVSRTSPALLTSTCIGILMRGPWPTKMVTIPSLQLFDWNALDSATLSLLFGELYHLYQKKPADYAHSTPRQAKLEHRDQFANFVVSNQPMMAVTYQVDPTLARINFQRSYPIFFILAQIALSAMKIQRQTSSETILADLSDRPAAIQPKPLLDFSSNSLGSSTTTLSPSSSASSLNSSQSDSNLSFDLPRVIVEELFHFAAAWTPLASVPNYKYHLSMIGYVRAEAHDALQRICQEDPRLYSYVMMELLHDMSLPNFTLQAGLQQLQPQLMIVDDHLLNSIAFLMCRRALEPLPPPNSPNYKTTVSNMMESIMADSPERRTDHVAWPVAIHLFSNLPWQSASPVTRAKAILLLVSLQAHVAGAPPGASEWILTALARLLSPNVVLQLGAFSTDLILSQLQHLPSDNPASLTVRIIIALNAVRTAITRQADLTATQETSLARFTYSWLWDSFRLKSMLDQLYAALKKVPATPVPVVQTQKPVQTPASLSSTINTATNTLNSFASSATNALFGIQSPQPSSSTNIGGSAYSTQTISKTSGGPPQPLRLTTPLLLLQRVVYHYAHCIKHSPGQLQREVSVLFNVLIDQLESLQKGSGMQVLEELFNESMGPTAGAPIPLEPSQQESRQLFLNFWVYALVPRLSSWNSSESLAKILDAFAYTAFFSQARFGEMVSLLPSNGTSPVIVALNETDLNHLLSKRYVWLAYFLIWAYTPRSEESSYQFSASEAATLELPPAKFRNTHLWKWFEAASNHHLPPSLALIFWERFFWCYFEVGAQMANFDFLPARWKNLFHSVLLRSGFRFANPSAPFPVNLSAADCIPKSNRTPLIDSSSIANAPIELGLHRLYAKLASWDKASIFTSGAYLFQPLLLPADAPEHGLLAELHSLAPVPSVFAIAFDPNQYEPVAQKPFPPLPEPEGADVIATQLIPVPRTDTSALFSNESNLNLAYIYELDKNYEQLLKSAAGVPEKSTPTPSPIDDFNPRTGENHKAEFVENAVAYHLPVIDDIQVWSAQVLSLSSEMRECDSREVALLRNMWKTVEQITGVIGRCSTECSGPGRTSIAVKVAVQNDPSSNDAIQRNRIHTQQAYSALVSTLKSIALGAVILEDLCRIVVDSPGSDVREKQCVYLFFELLPFLIDGSVRESSSLYSKLLRCAMILGQEAIQNKATRDHMRFFKMLLEGTKSRTVSTEYRDADRNASAASGGASFLPVSTSSHRLPLFELFTPCMFIHDGDHSVYVELLYIMVNTPHELRSDEEVALASQFNLLQTLPKLVDSHLPRLFDILELAAVRPALTEFVNMAITSILSKHAISSSHDLLDMAPPSGNGNQASSSQYQSHVTEGSPNTEIIGKVVRLVLLACPHSPMLGSWEMMKDNWLGPFVLPFVSSVLPSANGAVVSSAVTLVARVTSLPSFQMQQHFDMLARFFKALFSNATQKPLLNSKNRASFMSGFELIVARCHPNLIWPLYLSVLTPFFAHNSGIDLTQALDILCSANWATLESHLKEPQFVVQLASLPLFHIPLVRTIFSKINWIEYAAKGNVSLLESTAMSAFEPKMAHFLSLFCKINLLAPTYIDDRLRKLVFSISKQPNIWYQDGKHIYDWKKVNPDDFKSAFRGDSLVSAVVHLGQSQRPTDPTNDFKDNLQLLNDVCRHSGSAVAIEVCLEEIRSSLFFHCPSSISPGALWHLPVHANVECVTNYMIPLTQQYHQMQAEACTLQRSESDPFAPRMIYHQSSYDALVSLLAVVEPYVPPHEPLANAKSPTHFVPSSIVQKSKELDGKVHRHAPLLRVIESPVPFFSTPSNPGAIEAYKRDALGAAEIIRGLIVRFMGTLDNDLCLAVLHVASRAFPNNFHSLVGIWEEALRSYFVQSKFKEQLTIAVNAVSLPEIGSLLDILVPCAEMKCPLTMRIVLEREKQDWVNLPRLRFSERFVDVIPSIVACVPPQHREFDLLVVWFFVLDCIAHPKFLANQQTVLLVSQLIDFFNRRTGENKGFLLDLINKIDNRFDDSVHKEMLKLAMRACRLFMQRELLGKEPNLAQFAPKGIFPEDLEEQVTQISKLYPGPKGSEMPRYAEFFQQILPSMLSPLMDVATFEMKLVTALVPIAPYLQSFVEGGDALVETL